MAAKAQATKLTTIREEVLCAILNGSTDVTTSIFACGAKVLGLKEEAEDEIGTIRNAILVGGLGKHHDTKVDTDDGDYKTEIKHGNKNTPRAELMKRPWADGVQFLQGQVKSAMGKTFLDSDFQTSWFETEVVPFAREHAFDIPTQEGYFDCSSAMSVTSKHEPAAAVLVNALRKDSKLRSELQKRWLEFEMGISEPNHSEFETVVRKVLEEKQAWICINKKGAHWIPGFRVSAVRQTGATPKPKGGKLWNYILDLERKGDTWSVPIQLKLHWKNGGQAVQNLNYMIV